MLHVSNMLSKPALGYELQQEILFLLQTVQTSSGAYPVHSTIQRIPGALSPGINPYPAKVENMVSS